jgi:glycosyltransferase involved in cell wall biosynthesis
MQSPKLSIVVPTYKRPQLLNRCLESIYLNLGHHVQVVVVDDSDGGEGFDVAQKHSVTYIKKSIYDRRGLAGSRNIGLKYCVGDFVAFLDDDDFLATDHLLAMVSNAESADFIYGNYFEFNDGALKSIEIGPVGVGELLVSNRLPVGSFIIKRDKIKYHFDEELRSHEDWDFLLKNIYKLNLLQLNLFPVVIDKTNNNSSSHQARTRSYFWLDFLAVYARFPCPELADKRSAMLQNLGLNIPANSLRMEPYLNQRNFTDVIGLTQTQ